mgnify:CR=1 FL=1
MSRFSGASKRNNNPRETKTKAKISSNNEMVKALDIKINFPLNVENKAAVNAAKDPNTIPPIGFSEFSYSIIPIKLMIMIINNPIITSLGLIFRLYTHGSIKEVKNVPVEKEIIVIEIFAIFIPPKKQSQ